MLTPLEVCAAFSRALNRPCTYVRDPAIPIRVSIPSGYREQLEGIALLFGKFNAPYFPGAEWRKRGALTDEARELWEGWRGMEEYAREVFPVEEEANGLEWMKEGFEASGTTTPSTEVWLDSGGGDEARTI